MANTVIASAARAPVGSFNGAFANVSAVDLGVTAVKAALARAGVTPEDVSETILDQALTAGRGQNTARQTHVDAGLQLGASA